MQQIPSLFLSLQQLFILAPCARQIIVCSCFNLPNPGWKNTTQQTFIVGMLFIAILFMNKSPPHKSAVRFPIVTTGPDPV